MKDKVDAVRILIISLSASDPSVGRQCLPQLEMNIRSTGADVIIRDIRDFPPVWVDKRELGDFPSEYGKLYSDAKSSDGVIFIVPIHCYTMSGPSKIISEIIGDALTWKPVSFVTSAGTFRSHLAIRDLMASMMFEQDSICYPSTVQVTEEMINDVTKNKELQKRLSSFATGFVKFATALKPFAIQLESD